MNTSSLIRQKEWDVCILTCDNDTCHGETVKSLSALCHEDNFRYHHIPFSKKSNVMDIAERTIVMSMVICKHCERPFKEELRRIRDKSTVCLGRIGTTKLASFRNESTVIDTDSKLRIFYQKIKDNVTTTVDYDDYRISNDYEEGVVDGTLHCGSTYTPGGRASGIESKYLMPKQILKETQSISASESRTCDQMHSTTYDLPHRTKTGKTKQTTGINVEDDQGYMVLFGLNRDCNTCTEDRFLDVKTLLPSTNHIGAFVYDDFVRPKNTYRDFYGDDINAIVHAYNRDHEVNEEDMEKFIMTDVIKQCVTCRNFQGLIILLKCHKNRIQNTALQQIENFLYSMEFRRCNTLELLQGLKLLIELFQNWSIDKEMLLRVFHVAMASFSMLFLVVYGRNDTLYNSDILDVCELVKTHVKSIACLHLRDDVLKGMFDTMTSISSAFISHLNGSTFLRIDNWMDALKKTETRQKLRDEFAVFSEQEQCTCLFGVLNIIILHTDGHHEALFELLYECLEKMIKVKLKRKNAENNLLLHLLLVTKMAVKVLQENESNDTINSCHKLLNLYMNNDKIHQTLRQRLLKEIECLVFHRNSKVVFISIVLLSKNNCAHSRNIREMTVSHIERTLQPLDLSINFDSHLYERSSQMGPELHKYKGMLNNKCEVDIHILQPSKNCIMKGVMENYKRLAVNKETLKVHENQRDMLYLLCSERMTSYVLPLVAYQCRPLPMFFITLKPNGSELLHQHLMKRRSTKNWIDVKILSTMVADVMNAVKFIHSSGVIHRDLTTSSFSIDKDGRVFLSSFALAKVTEGSSEFISECLDIPLRWSAPESILYNRFGQQSDIYMIGQLIYELFTHGCHPYTELYRQDLDTVLQLIIFQNLKPRQWPCIPREIHEIILSCIETKPELRLGLESGVQRLNNYLASVARGSRKRLIDAHKHDLKYPEVDVSLSANPQRKLPEAIKQLKDQAGNPVQNYINLRKSRRIPRTILAVSEADIMSADDPVIKEQLSHIDVREPVSVPFYETSYTELTKSRLESVLNILDWPPRVERDDGDISLVYKCRNGTSLMQWSLSRRSGCPDDQDFAHKYIRIMYLLVQFVCDLHETNWILRDFCCRYLYYDESSGKVFAPRLGRMFYVNPDEVLDDSILDEKYYGRRNWLPIEALEHGQYSKEGDVYILAMCMYEFYMGLEIHTDNPLSSAIKCVPFCRVAKKQLIENLYNGEIPEQPMYCPDELYKVMMKCWNRDRTQRPSSYELLQELSSLLLAYKMEDDVQPCFDYEYATFKEDSPPLPPRHCPSSPSEYTASSSGDSPVENNKSSDQYTCSEEAFNPLVKLHLNTNVYAKKINPLYNVESSENVNYPSFHREDQKRGIVKKGSTRPSFEKCCRESTHLIQSQCSSSDNFSLANHSSEHYPSSVETEDSLTFANMSNNEGTECNDESSGKDNDDHNRESAFFDDIQVQTEEASEEGRTEIPPETVILGLNTGNECMKQDKLMAETQTCKNVKIKSDKSLPANKPSVQQTKFIQKTPFNTTQFEDDKDIYRDFDPNSEPSDLDYLDVTFV